MASPIQNQAQPPLPNVDLFDAYFRRADLDRDGRISGPEAVSFFQGSGLPKQVLAQIWAIANQSQSGFLGRAEFYNALKLVTVAQSKRDLTPEIVKAALYGPASAKIPPPQMNFNGMPTPQFNTSAAAPAHSQGSLPPSTPSLGYIRPQGPVTTTVGGQLPQNVSAMQQSQLMRTPQVQSSSSSTSIPFSGVSNQRFGIPSAAGATTTGVGTEQQSQLMKPQVQSPASSSFLAPVVSTQGFGGLSVARPDWSGDVTGAAAGTVSRVQAGGISPSLTQDGFKPVSPGSATVMPAKSLSSSRMQLSGQVINDSKTSGNPGNGFSSDLFSEGNVFSAISSLQNKNTTPPLSSVQTELLSSASSGSALPSSVASTALSLSASGIQHSPRPGESDSLQHPFPVQPAGGHHHHASFRSPSIPSPSGLKVGPQNLNASQSQHPWPKMTQTDIQKYTQVFVEVDRDRDGKITGEQARNLFLSWKLPREVLQHVWDLSDQDNDSMLSLREFCIALYLMERFREGRPLPQALPSSIMFDLSNVSQPMTQSSDASWGPVSGFQLQQRQRIPVSGARQLNPVVGRPPRPPSIPQSEEEPQINQQKSKVPVLETHLINQLSSDEQDALSLKFKEAKEADKKVEELEKEILDSREKLEFYRNKMQELVLYKSRCDNRLNEITERVLADKHEVESLAKKYEVKCKQTGDVASKLTTEEATFRDIQEKKMELYQAILKMEHDCNTDGDAQARANRIQSDLDEVVKSMNECCKKYGLRAKPMTLLELPFGWQPGIQEGAADWDEHWDKFEDEGFTFVKELTLEVQNVLAPPKQKLASAKNVKAPTSEGAASESPPNADYESEKPQSKDEQGVENGTMHDKSEDAVSTSDPRPRSPFSRDMDADASIKIPDSNLQRASINTLPHDKDEESDHGDHGLSFPDEKSFDESKWGTFDANEDIDSLWGFDFPGNSKDIDHERNGNHHAFDSGDNPIKTGSPSRSELFDRSGFTYDDSVPSTPLSIFSTSETPKRSKDWSEPAFDSFSRFDSFRTDDSGFVPPLEKLARFDSMRSSQDFDQSHHFDESDPFGSGPFKTSLESQNPRKT